MATKAEESESSDDTSPLSRGSVCVRRTKYLHGTGTPGTVLVLYQYLVPYCTGAVLVLPVVLVLVLSTVSYIPVSALTEGSVQAQAQAQAPPSRRSYSVLATHHLSSSPAFFAHRNHASMLMQDTTIFHKNKRSRVFEIVVLYPAHSTFTYSISLNPTFSLVNMWRILPCFVAWPFCVAFVAQPSLRQNSFATTANPHGSSCDPIILRSTSLSSTRNPPEDIYGAIHRKEFEMKGVKQQHSSITDPVRMALGYAQESVGSMRLAKALRRVYDDPHNPANPNHVPEAEGENTLKDKLEEHGMGEMSMRRAAFIVDIKRKSLSRPGETFCRFDNAALVADAMVQLGADVVFVNVDYQAYGGDISELKSAVDAVRKTSKTAAVVMKDIVVDEIQLGLAKESGADGILLIASVLGPALDNFLDLATSIGLETIVECHTRNEVQRALDALAPNIMVSNYDRVAQQYYPEQAIKLAGLFPGSGGPIISIAGGGIDTPEDMKRHLAVGYDAVVVGKACMGSTKAPEFIRVVRDRTLLPAELSQWGLEGVEFDMDGNPMPGPKSDLPDPYDDDVSYQ